jgi:flagellar basal-body rod protein FlgG
MKALYTAATGMGAQQLRIDNIANNLANVNTTAYKKSRHSFEDLYYEELSRGGVAGNATASSTPQVGGGVKISAIQKDTRQGVMTQTGNPAHMAIEGSGFFVLETPMGDPLYTRDGSFAVDNEGYLQTAGGYRLAGDLQIPIDAEYFEVQPDGEVLVKMAGEEEYFSVGRVEVANFVNPAGMRALGGNLLQASPESGEAQLVELGEQTKIMGGYVEGSNVDVAEELIEMIMAQRAYELTSKVVQTGDEMLQIATNLKR